MSAVLGGPGYGLAGSTDYTLQIFSVDPSLGAQVTTDDAGNVTLGFNENFDVSTMPGKQACLIRHEAVHINQVGNARARNTGIGLSGSEKYVSPFTSSLVGTETAAEAAMVFIPEVAGVEVVSDPIVQWRMLNDHASWLGMLHVFTRMDDPRYTVEHAIKDMAGWAPDYANRPNLESTFGLISDNVAARLVASSYALAAQYIDRALETGGSAGRSMTLEAIRRPVSAPELAILARGQTLPAMSPEV